MRRSQEVKKNLYTLVFTQEKIIEDEIMIKLKKEEEIFDRMFSRGLDPLFVKMFTKKSS